MALLTMRICLISNANNQFTRRWLEPLVAHGDDIHLISYKACSDTYPEVRDLIDLTRIASKSKFRWLIWSLWVRNYVHKLQPDVLHAHQVQGAGWLATLSGYHPRIVSSWGSDLLLEPDRSYIRRLVVRAVLATCDRLTVPSQFMIEIANNLGVPDEKIRCIPWGIDTKVFYPRPGERNEIRARLDLASKTKLIFCPRGISPVYNIDIVISAVRNNISRHPNLTLLLLQFNSDPIYLKRIQRQINEEGMAAHVIWLPAQDKPDDMARLFRAADIMVSIPDSEGYGSSVWEAMACGCPTVITDLPAFSIEMQNEVDTIKVPRRNIDLTSAAIDRLLVDQTLRERMISNGSSKAPGHSHRERHLLTRQLYEGLTGHSRP